LFWGVPREPLSPTSTAGGLAAAATTGALIAIGHRAGSIDAPFAAIGAVLLPQLSTGAMMGLVLTGLLLHVVGVFVWATVSVWFAEHQRWRLVSAAAVAAVAQFALSWIVAWSMGRGLASVLALGDRLVYALVLWLSLAVGMRFAFSPRDMHDSASSPRPDPL
jgi:hypothetical protein